MAELDMDGLLSHEEGRRDSYALLANCFHLPDEELVQALNGLPESDSEFYSGLAHVADVEDVSSLRKDYSKLFIGPYKLLAPPYGSIYLEGQNSVMGESTVDALYQYKREGIEVRLKEAPDHIAIELEFMFFLISKELEAIRDSNLADADAYQKKQKAFLELHLGRWISRFAEKVEANAETEFYKNLANLTKSFVEEDLHCFKTGNYPKVPQV